MKRLVSVCLALLLLWGLVPQLGISATAAHWADSYMQNLVRRDVMKGEVSGSLYPDRLITRAEFSAMLNRAFGFTQRANKSFSDVPKNAWYAADIDIASFQGYMQGDGRGANPGGNLTREEATTMLCRALKIAPATSETFALTDERVFANWSRGYINAAVNKHFVSGYPDGSFKPSNNITRGEASKMLSAVAGEIITSNKGWASGSISGNVTIASSGVNSSGATVMGDMYLTEGVGLGYVNLRNSNVNGEFIISGAGESNVGESSVTLSDCNISDLIVDVARQKILTLKTDGSTSIANTLIKSGTYLEELSSNYEGFDKVTVNGQKDTFLNLTGSFGDVRVISAGATIGLYKGQVSGITVDETAKGTKIFLEKDTYTSAIYFDTGATVTGKGQIDSVLINNDGVVIDQLPNNIYIRPGVTAKINGKVMGSLDAEMDGLAPAFMHRYPHADKILPAGFTEYYMTNKPGKIYYAVYNEDAAMPTEEALMAKNGPPKNALKSGNLSSLPDKEGAVAVSGLKAGQYYVIYSLFVDLRGKTSNIARTYVETVDNVMPVLLSGYPKVASLDKDSATVTLIPNKNTSYYWAVMIPTAVAPTSDQLFTQNVAGAVSKGITHGGVMNTPKDLDLAPDKTLEEFKPYVFYVSLRDGAENLSKTPYKLAFTTKDLTAPKFKPDDIYPKIGMVTASAIPVEAITDEACTIYWSAAKQGTLVLPLLTGGEQDFQSQKAKDIVKTGTSAFKFGKANASKADTKVSMSISGLEQQMPYDVYFMLEDKNGNQSDITKIVAKTKDIIPPTVTLDSDQLIGGNYSVDSPLHLKFSEIVCGSTLDANSDYIRFTKMFKDDPNALNNYIRLMDTTQVPEVRVDIDWSLVTVSDVSTQTVITIPKNAFNFKGAALDSLSNNNSYRFDFGFLSGHYVKDTSKNEMQAGTKINFKTVPPLTYFSEVKSIDSTRFDTAFLLRPDAQQTGTYIYFDILLRSAHRLTFDIHSGPDMNNLTLLKSGAELEANYATEFSSYLTGGKRVLYKELEETYYAIKLKKIDNIDLTGSEVPLTASFDLQMNAVIGNDIKLSGLRGPAKDFEARLKKSVDSGDVSSVTAPNDPFKLNIILVDNVPPDLTKDENSKDILPSYTQGDTQTVMKIRTTKECEVFYLAMPESEVSGGIPSDSAIRSARSDSKRGIAAGSFQVPGDSSIATEFTITGLLPPETSKDPLKPNTRKYVIYYFLMGKAPKPSIVRQGDFVTIEVASPKLEQLRYSPEIRSVNVSSSWDSDCTVFYVVYPKGTFGTTGPTMPTVDDIMNPSKGPELIASGSFNAKAKTLITQNITSTGGLEYTSKYSFYAVAQKYLGSPPSPAGSPSGVVCIPTMTPRDTDPPAIADGKPSYLTPTVQKDAADNCRYSGVVGVTFSEALYYFEQGSATAKPLKKDDFSIGGVADDKSNIEIKNYTEDVVEILDSQGEPIPGQTENCLRSISFGYTSILSGTTIEFSKTIGDRALNYAGSLRLTFTADPKEPENASLAKWTAQFIPAKP